MFGTKGKIYGCTGHCCIGGMLGGDFSSFIQFSYMEEKIVPMITDYNSLNFYSLHL